MQLAKKISSTGDFLFAKEQAVLRVLLNTLLD